MLADLLEEPARRAAAEGGVEHAEGEAAVVVAGEALHAEHQVDLLEGPGRRDRAGRDRAGPRRRAAAAPARSSRVEEAVRGRTAARTWRTTRRVVDVAGGRDHHVRRAGSAAGRSATIWSRVSAAIDSSVPAIGRPSGESPQACVGEQVVHDVVGVVVVHRDLVEDHVALGLDVLGGEQRAGDHVAEHVDGQRQVLVEDPRVEAGVLLGGEGVELAADRVEGDRDVQRRALRGALEQQVLEEVRAAVQRGRLVARADADPDADAGGADAGHLLGDRPAARRAGRYAGPARSPARPRR